MLSWFVTQLSTPHLISSPKMRFTDPFKRWGIAPRIQESNVYCLCDHVSLCHINNLFRDFRKELLVATSCDKVPYATQRYLVHVNQKLYWLLAIDRLSTDETIDLWKNLRDLFSDTKTFLKNRKGCDKMKIVVKDLYLAFKCDLVYMKDAIHP